MCTLRDPLQPKPPGIKKVLKREKPKLSRKKMIEECDVYIYDVHDTAMTDIEFAVTAFTKLPAE
jgi:adenylate kinase